MVRAATITIKDVGIMHESLARLAVDGLALHRCMSNDPTPEGWDSEAFATVMFKASKGMDLPGERESMIAVRSLINDYNEGRVKGSLQSKVYKAIHKCLPTGWLCLINKRAASFCPDNDPLSDAELKSIQSRLCKYGRRHGTHSAMYVIRTITNGWLTTRRMQELPKLPCIFGCVDCSDDLAHYLCCPTLWTIVGEIGPLPFDPTLLSVADRLCLTSPTFDHFRVCGIACWLYHGLKMGERSRIDELINSGRFADVKTLALELLVECPLKTI